MKSLSLTVRLSLLLSLTVMVILSLCGVALYHSLAAQIGVRDDGALLTRVDQIRTLLHDEDAVTLIQQKPRLFANMLGNTESLLVLRFPGQPPLIVVNPGQRPIPAITPVAANQPLSLGAVQHQQAADGTPFIAMAALSTTRDGSGQIEIISGRLMNDRTQTLRHYRDQIVIATGLAMLLVAAIGAMLLQRGLRPLRRLAAETRAVDVRHLSHRIRMHNTPSELQPLVAAFNQMLSRLESGYQQLSQLTADMAHDLRTPINTLIGQTEVALNQPRSVADYQQLLGSNYEELERLAPQVAEGSLCGLGKTAPNPVLTTLRYFRDEYEAHLQGHCPAGKCTALIKYRVRDNCTGCTICAQHCPVDAIPMTPYARHVIDLEKCTRCDSCRQVCPQGAVEVV